MTEHEFLLQLKTIPELKSSQCAQPFSYHPLWKNAGLSRRSGGSGSRFASVSMADAKLQLREFEPSSAQLLKHTLAAVSYVPRDLAIFPAGAAAKKVTAPLDRIELLMQTHGVIAGKESAKKV